MMKTGIQMSSFRPLMTDAAQVRETFRRVASLGCAWVQLQWIDRAVPVSVIAAALADAGLRSVSVQDIYEDVRADEAYYVDLNRQTGGEWLCVSRIPERLKSRAGLDACVGEFSALSGRLADAGQKLCFHPVSADYALVDGVEPVEYLLERMPELQICVDLYHLNRTGADMPRWIAAHAGRLCMAHFKDEKAGRLVPAGQGDTNWRGVASVCAAAGVEYGFVEQERWEGDPFACLGEALAWLNGELTGL